MLISLLIWVWITIIALIFGVMLIRVISRLFNLYENVNISLPVVFIAGIMFLTTVSSYFSLFIKIGLLANCILIITAIVYCVFDFSFIKIFLSNGIKRLKTVNIYIILLFISIFIVFLIESSFYIPKNYDTSLYHAQAIHWIEKFRVIPGLGNLYFRLAYNSSWFITSALFSFSFLGGQSFHILNGIFSIIFLIYLLTGLDRLFKGEYHSGYLFGVIALPIMLFLYANFISSPDTDTPAVILIWMIFLIYFEKSDEKNTGKIDISSILVLLFSVFLLTVKISGLPILFFSVYILFIELKSGRINNFIKLSFISLIIVLPWLIRFVIISGYLVYPFNNLDIFAFDWKMPLSILLKDKTDIALWSFKKPPAMPLWDYIPAWYSWLRIQYKAVVWPLTIMFFAGIMYYIYSFLFKRKNFFEKLKITREIIVIHLAAYISIIFLFLTAPDFRYGAGFITAFFIIHIIPALQAALNGKRIKDIFIKGYSVLCIILIIVLEIILFSRYFYYGKSENLYGKEDISVIPSRLIMPAEYRRGAPGIKSFTLNKGLNVYSHGELNWYEPFPSAVEINPGLMQRGNRIEDGFNIISK